MRLAGARIQTPLNPPLMREADGGGESSGFSMSRRPARVYPWIPAGVYRVV